VIYQVGDTVPTYSCITVPHCLLIRVGSGDVSAHRCGLIGSCSSSVHYSASGSILA